MRRAHVRILPVDVATIGNQFPQLVVVTVTCGVPHRRGLEQRDDRRVPLLPCIVKSRLASFVSRSPVGTGGEQPLHDVRMVVDR